MRLSSVRFRCGICKGLLSGTDEVELDHIIPRSLGGPRQQWNLRIVHKSCNRRRRDTVEPVQLPMLVIKTVLRPAEHPSQTRRPGMMLPRTVLLHRAVPPKPDRHIPVAKDFVYIGADTFLPQFQCSFCGFVNTYEGDSCGCKRRRQSDEYEVQECCSCGERVDYPTDDYCYSCSRCSECGDELAELGAGTCEACRLDGSSP